MVAGSVARMGWVAWLAVPVLVTSGAAIVSWLRALPARTPHTDETVRAHADYLDALTPVQAPESLRGD